MSVQECGDIHLKGPKRLRGEEDVPYEIRLSFCFLLFLLLLWRPAIREGKGGSIDRADRGRGQADAMEWMTPGGPGTASQDGPEVRWDGGIDESGH